MENDQPCKKFCRKIKIKLIDPNDPNSYVCEIIENNITKNSTYVYDESLETNKITQVRRDLQIKNYFQVLMSNENKKKVEKKSKYLTDKKKKIKNYNSNKGNSVTNGIKDEEDCEIFSSDEEIIFNSSHRIA